MSHRSISRSLFSICLVASTMFIILAILVTNGITTAFDESALLWINQHANDTFNSLFVALTQLGGIYLVAGVSLAMLVYFVLKKRYYKALFVVVSIGGAALVNVLLKTLFDRSRPDLWQHLVTETSFSFPSGHSSASAALAFTVIVLLWNTKWRTVSLSIGALYIVTIGFSRMYLGVHFPSDVLGGWLLAASWVTLMAGILYSYKNRRKGTDQ